MNIVQRLDEIFKELDDLLLEGRYKEADEILSDVNVNVEPLTILVGYLTITFQWRDVLLARVPLMHAIRERVEHEVPERAEGILSGLD